MNLINGKSYIGQTTLLLKQRLRGHFSLAKEHEGLLYRAMRKYGVEQFQIDQIDQADSREELDAQETWHILLLNTVAPLGYNILLGGGGTSGISRSDETRRKISEAKRGISTRGSFTHSSEVRAKISTSKLGHEVSNETRLKISAHNRSGDPDVRLKISETLQGRKPSDEERAKMSIAGKGRIIFSDTRQKISEALKGRKLSDEQRLRLMKTHCKYGHPLIPENLYQYAYSRACKICTLERSRLRRQNVSNLLPAN